MKEKTMDELIFFFIPGLVVALTIIGIYPNVLFSKEGISALTFFSPLAGYTIHQLFRCFNEWYERRHRKSRIVFSEIFKLAKNEDLPISRNDAWIVWEIGIRDNKDFKDFRDHDVRTFHYIYALWSTSKASFIGILILLSNYLYLYFHFQIIPWYPYFYDPLFISLFILIFLIIFTIIFEVRGYMLYRLINKQELAFLKMNKVDFIKCMYKISNINIPIKYKSDNGYSKIICFFQKKISTKKRQINGKFPE